MQCQNNLQQIGMALQAYHHEYGSFPPAFVADANGKPLYSWRVLILPFLDQGDLANQIRRDEAWDGPNNAKSTQIPLFIFDCPSDSQLAKSLPALTSYVAVVGPHTAWSWSQFDEGCGHQESGQHNSRRGIGKLGNPLGRASRSEYRPDSAGDQSAGRKWNFKRASRRRQSAVRRWPRRDFSTTRPTSRNSPRCSISKDVAIKPDRIRSDERKQAIHRARRGREDRAEESHCRAPCGVSGCVGRPKKAGGVALGDLAKKYGIRVARP